MSNRENPDTVGLVKDSECVAFLQWALPQLHMRWPGYRKVRRQVCKRIVRRMRALDLHDVEAYRARLAEDSAEWAVLDSMTRITISRFFRDRDVFAYLCDEALPALHRLAAPGPVRIWSAGCAGGEEAYTLGIAGHREGIPIQILGTDADEHQLERARRGLYSSGSLKDLPEAWRATSFEDHDGKQRLKRELRNDVHLALQDIRREMPDGPFHLVLCRYLAFTYFDEELQQRIAQGLLERTAPRGLIVLGKRESWPDEVPGVIEVRSGLPIYRKN